MSYVVTFVSRNKDNVGVKDFHPRVKNILVDTQTDKVDNLFADFVNKGVKDEFCRSYLAINETDEEKVKVALAKFLIDEAVKPSDWSLTKIQSKVASLSALPQNKKTKYWLFDCDCDHATTVAFIDDILKAEPEIEILQVSPTPHGYALIVSRGFDTREILKKYPNIELKKDSPVCTHWARK